MLWLATFRQGKAQLDWRVLLTCTVLMDVNDDYENDVYYTAIRANSENLFGMGLVLEEPRRMESEFDVSATCRQKKKKLCLSLTKMKINSREV